MFSLLVIKTDFQAGYIKLNEIQSIEMTDISIKEGGIMAIWLKDRKEEVVYRCNDAELWQVAKDFIDKEIYGMSKEMSKTDIDLSNEYKREF
jgi:hypothetical protein